MPSIVFSPSMCSVSGRTNLETLNIKFCVNLFFMISKLRFLSTTGQWHLIRHHSPLKNSETTYYNLRNPYSISCKFVRNIVLLINPDSELIGTQNNLTFKKEDTKIIASSSSTHIISTKEKTIPLNIRMHYSKELCSQRPFWLNYCWFCINFIFPEVLFQKYFNSVEVKIIR